jgi:hypothetical protein
MIFVFLGFIIIVIGGIKEIGEYIICESTKTPYFFGNNFELSSFALVITIFVLRTILKAKSLTFFIYLPPPLSL